MAASLTFGGGQEAGLGVVCGQLGRGGAGKQPRVPLLPGGLHLVVSAQGRQLPPNCRQHYFLNLGIEWCLLWAGTPAYM